MCSVAGCKTSAERGAAAAARCFGLPGDPDRRLGCSEHFTEDCFEKPTQVRAGALLLKSTATPSLHAGPGQPGPPGQPGVDPARVDPAGATSADKAADAGYQGDELLDRVNHSTCPGEPTLLSKGVQVNPVSCGVSVSCSTDVSYPVTFERSRAQQEPTNREDLVKQKFVLLQTKGKFIVNESCLLQLFRRNCPSCGSSCKLEKILHGSLVTMNQQCIKCEYKFQWKSQVQASLPTAQGQQQTGDTESTAQSHQEGLHQAEPSHYGSNCSVVPVIVSEVIAFSDEEQDSSDEKGGGDYRCVGAMESSSRVKDYDPSDLPDFGSSFDMNKEIPEDDFLSRHGRHERELCSECGTFFKALKPHTCEHKIKPYPCNVCGKRCATENALQRHNKIHNENYMHLCRFCLKIFKTRVDKITHEQSHSPTLKPYKCPDCPEAFTQLHVRNRHLRGHRGVKKYACRFCKFEFLCENQLLRHERVHTGVKPFVCEVCQRSFNQEGHLKSHMRLHTGERPYKCPHCDRSFNHNISRKNHVQRHHSEVHDSGHRQFEVDMDENEDKGSVGDAEESGCSRTVTDAGLSLELDEEDEEVKEEGGGGAEGGERRQTKKHSAEGSRVDQKETDGVRTKKI
ncbi:zinc finger protein 135-like [Lampris incognitus]|uniref:zinc finger protein 135-like n=1 Tax=Lampris incognitus TaxID=2546036 RepID=UPI0024B51082|nr:zinc finger protein 135-like [Lampris incognitus]